MPRDVCAISEDLSPGYVTAYAYDGSGGFLQEHAYQQRGQDKGVAINVGRYISSDPIGLAGGLNTFGYVRQNPVMGIDPLALRPLTDCEKTLLLPYIPAVDLENADLNIGIPSITQAIVDPEGVTYGNSIYISERVNLNSPEGIATIGHELVHVGQYRLGGIVAFFLRYSTDALIYGTGPENPYETPAYALEHQIEKDYSGKNFDKAKQDCNKCGGSNSESQTRL